MSDIEKIKDDLRRTGFHAAAVAIEAVESLERQLADSKDQLRVVGDALIALGDEYNTLRSELERVTAERDVAKKSAERWKTRYHRISPKLRPAPQGAEREPG